MLEVLACSSRLKIFQGRANYSSRIARLTFSFSTFQELKETLGMFLFLIGGFFKDVEDLFEPFLFRLVTEIGVPVSRLGFTRKCCYQVFSA